MEGQRIAPELRQNCAELRRIAPDLRQNCARIARGVPHLVVDLDRGDRRDGDAFLLAAARAVDVADAVAQRVVPEEDRVASE